MPIVRKLVAQNGKFHEWLKVDSSQRYVINKTKFYQMLFGPNSSLTNSSQIVKISAQFDPDTLNNIKMTAYLYEPKNGTVAAAGNCSFRIFKVSAPSWTETLLTTLSGSLIPNNYWYVNPTLATLPTVNFDSGDTIMIEATLVRSGVTYRDRIYFNHLGVYDSILRLRNDVEFLDITKLDE